MVINTNWFKCRFWSTKDSRRIIFFKSVGVIKLTFKLHNEPNRKNLDSNDNNNHFFRFSN